MGRRTHDNQGLVDPGEPCKEGRNEILKEYERGGREIHYALGRVLAFSTFVVYNCNIIN
jgi:hypothetical protein